MVVALTSCVNMRLHLLGGADGLDELLVLLPPVTVQVLVDLRRGSRRSRVFPELAYEWLCLGALW